MEAFWRFFENPWNVIVILAIVMILQGVAILLHVRKSPRDAHGRNRKFL